MAESELPVVLNGRSLTREQPTGVDKLPALLADRASADPHLGIRVARPDGTGRIRTNLWEQFALPLRARDAVLVSLANSGPVYARRQVVMIHDLSPWDQPEWFSRPYRLKSNAVARSWARTAPIVLVPSDFSGLRCVSVLGVDPERIRVVGNGHRWGDSLPTREPANEPFVLTVSTLSARKNLDAIVAAWPDVRRRHPGLRLKVVGAQGARLLAGDNRGSKLDQDGIDYLGYVDDDQLDSLFRGAAALVSASSYEGFNIPVLDALVAGVPVAISDIAVHRELYGEVAARFATDDIASISATIAEAVDRDVDDRIRSTLAERFSDDAVLERVINAINHVRSQN